MLLIRLASRNIGRNLPPDLRWLYLGKDSARRAAYASVFGFSNLHDVRERFHRICEDLRQPFLDFVARVGQKQNDRLGWYSSSFGWKDPDASDLFLLICYLTLIRSLENDKETEPLLIVVEDPWLYAQCRRTHATLWPSRVRSLIRAIAARARWMVAIVREYRSLARHAEFGRGESHDVWLYSLPHRRCFEKEGEWNDPFFGNLDSVLEKSGHSVGRLIPVDPLGFADDLARRASHVHPAILELSPIRLLTSLLAMWRRPRHGEIPTVNGLDVTLLAEREWWMDLSHASWCQHRLFYECTLAAERRHRPSLVIFPYENQPWEKMLVSATRDAGVSTVGYQHSTVPRFLLSYFFGKEDGAWSVLPDVILTAGKQQARLLIDGGTPASKVRVGGSLRHAHLARRHTPAGGSKASGRPRRVILVTTHDLSLSSELLAGIETAFPDHGKDSNLSFFYRPHPTLASMTQTASRWITLVEGSLSAQLSSFDVVVTTGSTVGLEAVIHGIPVVKYQADVLIDLDPLDAIPESEYLTSGRRQLRQTILEAANRRQADTQAAALFAEDVFGTVNEAVWIAAVNELRRPRPDLPSIPIHSLHSGVSGP